MILTATDSNKKEGIFHHGPMVNLVLPTGTTSVYLGRISWLRTKIMNVSGMITGAPRREKVTLKDKRTKYNIDRKPTDRESAAPIQCTIGQRQGRAGAEENGRMPRHDDLVPRGGTRKMGTEVRK